MKVVLVGGGTGGHIYPAIAVAQAIQNKIIDSQILFIGSEEGLETKIVQMERYSLVTIRSRGMLRKLSLRSISAPFYAIAGTIQSIRVLKEFKPDIVIATGGFVSLPVLLAAFFLRIPSVLHECNVIPGISARLCKWLVKCVTIAFEKTRKYFRWKKVYFIGNPVRQEIIKTLKSVAIQKMGIKQGQKIVLVLGGSQGARSLNRVLIDSLGSIAGLNIQVIHVSGERDHQWAQELTSARNYDFYRLIPYMHNIWDGLAAADLVISRAGATAISEILVRGLPSILVPFPFSAENHQELNANVLRDAGAAIIIKDNELNTDTLTNGIRSILQDRDKYQRMGQASLSLRKSDAAAQMVSIITGILGVDLNVRKRKTRAKKT